MTRLLILIAIAFVIVSAAIGWMLRTWLPGVTPVDILAGLTPILQVLAFFIVIAGGVGVFGGLKGDRVRVRSATIFAVVFGVLGAGCGELNTHFGWLYDSEITFAAMVPGRLESLTILALGLLGALPGLGLLQLRRGVRRV